MKTKIYLLGFITLLCTSCNNASKQAVTEETAQPTNILSHSDSIKGNFSANDKSVYAWYVSKGNEWAIEDSVKSKCFNYIEFSDSDIPRITTNYWLSSKLANEGDLNNDGKDEIGAIVMTDSEMGTWHKYHVWTLQNGKWENLIEPFDIFIGSDLNINDLVKIDSTDKSKIVIRYNELKNNNIVTKEKSVWKTKKIQTLAQRIMINSK